MQQDTKRKNDGFDLKLARKWRKMNLSHFTLLLSLRQVEMYSWGELEKMDNETLKKLADAINTSKR